MIVCIGDILDQANADRIRDIIGRGSFRDGGATAGVAAGLVKNNLQLAPYDQEYREAVELIITKVRQNLMFQMIALPKTLRPPIISRSNTGMGYGVHIDNAMMGDPPVRADLSYTLFLSAPDEYEGGELVLEDTQGEHSFKLPQGAMVLYPSTFLHRVDTVRAGSRLVAAGWVQSLCRHANHREILFDIQRLQRSEFEKNAKSAEFDLLTKTFSNLFRLFSEV
jgi:PKHD-type hydroxylase